MTACIHYSKIVIDSRSRTYNPHLYLGLYDGYACFRLEPYLATDTLLFQLGNINQKRTKIIAHFCRSVK